MKKGYKVVKIRKKKKTVVHDRIRTCEQMRKIRLKDWQFRLILKQSQSYFIVKKRLKFDLIDIF